DAAVLSPDSWERVANEEIGEIAASGPQIMLGYWQRPDETDRVIKDGWLRTGDLGYRDDDGFFHIVDRIKDMIIAGGYNVYPREIEEVLFHHPDILEASVVGVQSEYRGETVKAFVVLKPGVEPDTESILTLCREELAAFKVPKIVEFVDSLPKSLIGKVLRRELRESDRGNEIATLTSVEFIGPEPVTSEAHE
ncbi:MAG TPA: long-chain fatty acid--CoA ligase, partial [Chloroflexota bacterium]|nr:long-chain fatty acid--CoA ligase [Chloroflexota bacterium]